MQSRSDILQKPGQSAERKKESQVILNVPSLASDVLTGQYQIFNKIDNQVKCVLGDHFTSNIEYRNLQNQINKTILGRVHHHTPQTTVYYSYYFTKQLMEVEQS